MVEIFDLARIDYGRIDYGLKDGKIQFWEINTNPIVIVRPELLHPVMREQKARLAEQLECAFLALIESCARPANLTIVMTPRSTV